jgi:hypothetical protein
MWFRRAFRNFDAAGAPEHMDELAVMRLTSVTVMTSVGMSTRNASAASSSGIVKERKRSERKRVTRASYSIDYFDTTRSLRSSWRST